MEEIHPNYKIISEKNKFINYLENLSNSIHYKNIGDNAQTILKRLFHFNYPIEFSNQELFYYKCYYLLIREIAHVFKKSPGLYPQFIKERIKVAKFVIHHKILDNTKILNNEDKMNILIILILFDELNDEFESINFNRLLQTESVSISELQNYVSKYKLGKLENNNSSLILQYTKNEHQISKPINLKTICLKNLRKNILYSENLLYDSTLDALLINNEISLYINKIQSLLIKFIHSKVYREAILKLFPTNYKCLLGNNLNDMEIFIKNRLKFYPYQDLYNSGLTDKLSFYSYIPIIFPLNHNLNESIYPIFKISSTVENSIHEINHIYQDILYFKENSISLFHTPKREDFQTGQEGGNNIEEILFGRVIHRIGILESLYILNETNFNQSLEDYKNNFLKLYDYTIPLDKKMTFIEIKKEGIFYELVKNNIEEYIIKGSKGRDVYAMDTKNKNIEIGGDEIYITRGRCVLPS